MRNRWMSWSFFVLVLSAPLDTDLLHASSWKTSTRMSVDACWGAAYNTWLEGGAVLAPDGEVVNVLRVDNREEETAAIMHVSRDGSRISFNPERDFIRFPGGCKRFVIRYDPVSKRYWSLTNWVPEAFEGYNPERTRNTLALVSSGDLRDWIVHRVVLQDDNVDKSGFQYVDWQMEGEDIVFVSRTAFFDGIYCADNQHNANFITFHRIPGLRSSLTELITTIDQESNDPGEGANDQLHPDHYATLDPRAQEQDAPKMRTGYRLAWSDEFNNAGRPDATKWSYEQGFVRNRELQWYQPENAVVQDGALVITGKSEQVENPEYEPHSKDWRRSRPAAEYTSASINTREKFSFRYGMMEVRARIDTSMGSWPAIWTLGTDRRWPANGEVDVMEYYRVDGKPMILANAAWEDREKREPVWDDAKIPLAEFLEKDPDWFEKFHVWKMVWNEDHIRLYLDEQLLNEIAVEEATCPDGFNPFRQPHYILLNLALGANGGDPAGTTFPITYEVDYVRVYEALKATN